MNQLYGIVNLFLCIALININQELFYLNFKHCFFKIAFQKILKFP